MSSKGNITQNVNIDGTLQCSKSATFPDTTVQSLNATGQVSAASSVVAGLTQTNTLSVASTLNTKDATTGALTSAACNVSGGAIIQKDALIQGLLSAASATVAGALTSMGTATLNALSVVLDSVLAGSLTLKGKLTHQNTQDYTPTVPGAFQFQGGGSIAGALAVGAAATVLASDLVPTVSPLTGNTVPTNVLRLRSDDGTNSTFRVSVANSAMGNTYYDSGLVLWSLGFNNTSVNYERMLFGINSAGGYLNYNVGGTGTTKPFNLLGGAIFSQGGALQLNKSLNLNGVTRIAAPSTAYTLTEPSTLPAVAGCVLGATTTGVQSWVQPGFSIFTGDGNGTSPTLLTPSIVPRWYILTQTLQNTSGQMVFYLTSTGTSGGTILGTGAFLSIVFAARSPSSNVSNTAGPFASESYRGTNGVVCNVFASRTTTVIVGANVSGLQAAPTGTIVTCMALIA